jgi:uncharacterized membrane protein
MDRRPTESRWSDERLQVLLGNALRAGVLAAAGVVLVGGLVFLGRHGGESPNYRVFHGEPSDLRSVAGIVADAISLRGRGLIQLGLLLLIATPIMRVALSLVGFEKQRDWTYVAVTATVLTLLLYSLFGGRL